MWVSSLIRHPRLYTLCFRLVCCVELWADNNFTQETAMTMITPSYLGETIEYSSLHACRSTLEDPTRKQPRNTWASWSAKLTGPKLHQELLLLTKRCIISARFCQGLPVFTIMELFIGTSNRFNILVTDLDSRENLSISGYRNSGGNPFPVLENLKVGTPYL